jgi:arylsulfatase A-like enzyme
VGRLRLWSMRCLFATVVLTACALAQECPTDTVANRCIETAAYKYVNASTAAACCAVCAAEAPTCLVWVLAKPTEARPLPCRLKNSTKPPTHGSDKCLFSGQYPPAAPTPAPPTPAPAPTPPPSPAAPTPPPSPAPRPHIVFILQDDLGHDDVAFNGNAANEDVSASISALARSGIALRRHYVHWHCSPTRRTLLTGRLPLHHSELLSGIATDDIDLRWRTIAHKLRSVGYTTVWSGKGHTGYKSTAHLPAGLGFDHFTGFLSGAQSYFATDRWRDAAPLVNGTYSTVLYGDATLALVGAHDAAVPLFLYLPWQNVHAPYDVPPAPWGPPAPPGGSAGQGGGDFDVLRAMLSAADDYVGRLVALLQAKGMWDNTLVVYSADNGGVNRGSNWPLRGEKHTSWEGAMRVAAFVSGGFVPEALRGTNSSSPVHVADWVSYFAASGAPALCCFL